jgi:hypothetical protein
MSEQERVAKLHLEIILKFISLRCRHVRRCKNVRCRRSGRCLERAQTIRSMGPRDTGSAPNPPRRARFRRENLLERVRSA